MAESLRRKLNGPHQGTRKESRCARQRNEIAPSGGERGAPPSREARSRKSSLPLLPQGTRGGLGGPALTLPLHASSQALLIAAVLTAVTLTLVDEAVLVIPARVDEVFPYGSLEEAFAAFTTVHTIVLSWPQEKDIPQVVLVFICVFHSKEPLGSPQKN